MSPDYPRFELAPPLRCCQRDEGSGTGFCGKRAKWIGRSGAHAIDAFYCDEHRPISYEAISEVTLFRRVHLHVDVYLAAVTHAQGPAQQEAYELVDRELKRAGACTGLLMVTSVVGLGRPLRGTAVTPRGPVKG